MPGPSGNSDPCSPSSPAGCRWAALAKHEANDPTLIDLPPSEQVSRGKELLSMLWSEDAPFPAGDNSLSMPKFHSNDAILPPMPQQPPNSSEMHSPPPPPPPPGFEVPLSSGLYVDSSSVQMQSHQHQQQQQQPRDWVLPPTGPSQPLVQQQPHSHFAAPRSSPPAPAPPSLWGGSGGGGGGGMGGGGLVGSGAPGAWAPLSTNPGNSMSSGGWLSTGVSDRDGSAVAVSNSSAMTHTHIASSASNAHIAYSMPSQANADNGLWSAPAASSSANINSAGMMSNSNSMLAPSSMQMGAMAAGLQNAMPSMMMQAQKPVLPNQLRAEAAPYVPMNMGVGVPAC